VSGPLLRLCYLWSNTASFTVIWSILLVLIYYELHDLTNNCWNLIAIGLKTPSLIDCCEMVNYTPVKYLLYYCSHVIIKLKILERKHNSNQLIIKYKYFSTKIFIRFPRVLFETEDAFQHRKHELGNLSTSPYLLLCFITCWIM